MKSIRSDWVFLTLTVVMVGALLVPALRNRPGEVRTGNFEVLAERQVEEQHRTYTQLHRPTGKHAVPVHTSETIPAHLQVQIEIDGERHWITLPEDRVDALGDPELRMRYQLRRDGSPRVLEIMK